MNHPRYKGGYVNQHGYREICIAGKQVLEHRHVMERHLGRPLLDSEVVHHKDGTPANNELANLELIASQSEHVKLHFSRYRTDTHKQCKKCLLIKPRAEFHAAKLRGRDPNHSVCKSCRRAYYADRWKASRPPKKLVPEAVARRRAQAAARQRRYRAKKKATSSQC